MAELVVGAVLAFLVLGLVALVSAELTRPLWRSNPALGPAFGVIGVGLAGWLQFLASWADPLAGRYAAFALVLGTLVLAGRFRVWRTVRSHPALVMLPAGILLAYLGFTFLWAAPDLDAFSLTALRYSFSTSPYPIDNAIPFLLANTIQDGGSTHAFLLSWNGSDRPPLQSGTILTFQAVFGSLGLTGYTLPQVSGMVLQLAWIPAVWSMLRVLSIDRRTTALSIVFTAATATMLINATYTWPKLIAAALVIACLAILVAVIRGTLGLAVGLPFAALAFALGMLSHGAAAFALPAVIVLAVLALLRNTGRLRAAGVSAAVVLVTYLPWVGYQRFFDPPGDRLLKWHLAGVIPLDDRSFARALVDAYASTSLSDVIAARVQNLGVVVDPFLYGSPLANPLVVLDPSQVRDAIGAQRFNEYYSTAGALSLGAVLLVALVLLVVVALIRRRPLRLPQLLGVLALMVPCNLLWCLVMFIPGATVVHQGSHVWIVVLLAGAFAWFASRWRLLGAAIVVAQVALTGWFYAPFFGHTELRPSALVLAVLGMAVVLAGLLLVNRQERRRTTASPVLEHDLARDDDVVLRRRRDR